MLPLIFLVFFLPPVPFVGLIRVVSPVLSLGVVFVLVPGPVPIVRVASPSMGFMHDKYYNRSLRAIIQLCGVW